ncbi:MAG TPA: LLM class flavin-dependent oxidoreductase [Actinomycetota bacterium]|nr:LLM class flavin-dependent oxidoreductase [Actinomycetota bacterium]
MRYGVTVPNIGELDLLLAMGREAEAAGWDGFFLWDHIRFSDAFDVAVHDPWVALSGLAATTETIRLGPLVTPLARRRPWKLARETVTLDHLSHGRVVLGAGLGFPPDVEFGSFGEPTGDRERAELLDEGLAVLDGLWSGDPVSIDGRHHRIDGVRFLPRPVQRPRIPVWIAGMWPNRAPFRRAARWDGVFPIAVVDGEPCPIAPDGFAEALAYTRSFRTAAGPFDAVVQGAPDTDPDDYAAAGATWWLLTDDGGSGWESRLMGEIHGGPPR